MGVVIRQTNNAAVEAVIALYQSSRGVQAVGFVADALQANEFTKK